MAKRQNILILRKKYPFVKDIYDRTSLFLLTLIAFLGFDFWWRGPAELKGYGYTIIVVALLWYLWRVIQYFAKLDKESFHFINTSAITWSSFKPLWYILLIIVGCVGMVLTLSFLESLSEIMTWIYFIPSMLVFLYGIIALLVVMKFFKLLWWICKIPFNLIKLLIGKTSVTIVVEWDSRNKFQKLQDSVKELEITNKNFIAEIRQIMAVMQLNKFVVISSTEDEDMFVQYVITESGILMDMPTLKKETDKRKAIAEFLHSENIYPRITILGQILNPGLYYDEVQWSCEGKNLGYEFHILFKNDYLAAATFGKKVFKKFYKTAHDTTYTCELGSFEG